MDEPVINNSSDVGKVGGLPHVGTAGMSLWEKPENKHKRHISGTCLFDVVLGFLENRVKRHISGT